MTVSANAQKFGAMKHKMKTRLNDKPAYYAMFLINFYQNALLSFMKPFYI